MKTQYKTGILLLTTLIVGIIIGALALPLIGEKVIERRIEKIRTRPGFSDHMLRIIEPDESQIQEIENILKKHGERIHRFNEEIRRNMKAQGDSLFYELKPLLKQEQLDRLQRFFERQKKRQRKMPPGPGPHMERRHPGDRQNRNMNRIMKFDQDNDGRISRDESRGFIAEQFDELDKNRDGFLDAHELDFVNK